MSSPSEDPFDSLLTLEDSLYSTAYALGASDGAHAGRIEGRIFGLEKGFERFAELGELHGRSVVWASRLLPAQDGKSTRREARREEGEEGEEGEEEEERVRLHLPPLPHPVTARLHTNTTLLHALTDPSTFDASNHEAAVADYDDRFRRAGAKCKVIARMVGESESPEGGQEGGGKARGVGDASMEDFAGSRLVG